MNESSLANNLPAATHPASPQRIFVTGLAIDPVDREQLFNWVIEAAKMGRQDRLQRTVGYLNVHVANLAARDRKLRAYLNTLCNLVYCDGKGIGWGAKLQGLAEPPRMTAADWLPELLVHFRDEGLRLFVVAGKPGVVDQAIENITQRTGPLGPIATHDGYVDERKTDQVIQEINAFKPDVVLVGMGSPTQEHWTHDNRLEIDAPVVWPLGATFDYFTDEQERGPQWLRDIGHEWAARLVADPGRLWKRYLVGNPQFLLRSLWSNEGKSE